MNDSDIDDALDEFDVNNLTDFEHSGSEYVPSSIDSDDSSADSEVEVPNAADNAVHIPTTVNLTNPVNTSQIVNTPEPVNIEVTQLQTGDIFHTNQTQQGNQQPLQNNHPVAQLTGRQRHSDVIRVWHDCTETVRQFPYIGTSGLQNDLDVTDPMLVYEQFFTNDVLDLIVGETNRFAEQFLASNEVSRRSMMRQWLPCDREEIKRFLGIVMIMGLCPLPQMRLYWSSKDIFKNDVIKNTMKRDRFESILKCLHFHDNNVVDECEPRLSKIKELSDLLNSLFKKVYVPGEEVVIDESVVPWRGRLVFRQYNPNKSHKYGVKLYKICSVSGYTQKVKIYAGKSDSTASVGHAQNVVIHLMDDLLDSGRTLYCDNFYNSVPLAENLLEMKTYVCGTLRKDRRGNPTDLCATKLKKGEVKAKENEFGVKVIIWKDKRHVLMVSTRPEDVDNLLATGKHNRKGEVILKPSSVLAYNAAKKGVDYSDQMSAYYTALRKSTKWYKKVAIELLLGTCVVNAFVIFNEFRGNKKCEMLRFREELIKRLIAPAAAPQQPIRRRPGQNHNLLQRPGPARTSRKRCLPCYEKMSSERGAKEARKNSKRVVTYCNGCPEEPAMCLDCFNIKHK